MPARKKTLIQVTVGVALLCALLWSAWFIRGRLTRSRIEDILAEMEQSKGSYDPGGLTELRDLGDRAIGILVERLQAQRYGDGALRAAFLAIGFPSVSPLVDALGDEKPEIRLFAAKTLGKFEIEAKEIIPALTGALGDEAADVRAAAAGSIGHFGSDAEDATASLVKCLDDPYAPVRRAAMRSLGEVAFPEPQPDLLAALVKSLADSDPGVRQAAAGAIMGFGTPDEAVGSLVEVLARADEPADVRLACAWAIRDIGPRGQGAIGPLRTALADPDRRLREEAAKILGRFEVERAQTTSALIGALGDKASDVRVAVAEALGKYGPDAQAATAPLVKRLGDPSPAVRAAAAIATGKVAGADPRAAAALVGSLADKDPNVRQAAVYGLIDLGLPDAAIVAVVKLLDDASEPPHVRWTCAHAFARVADRGKPAVDALKRALEATDRKLRRQAAEALNKIEASAGAAGGKPR